MEEVPVQSQPQPTSKGINWKTVIIGAVIGGLVVGAGALGFYLYQGQSEDTTSTQVTTQKIATDSAKEATPSAKKDETADWKTYTSTLAGYSIKYPQALNKGLGYGDVGFLMKDFSNYKFPENVALSTACEAGTGVGEEDCFTIYTSKEPRDVTEKVNNLEVGDTVKNGQTTYTRQKSVILAGYEWTVFTTKFSNSDYRYSAKVDINDIFYVISIRAESESTVNSNIGLLEKIVSTFKLLN